MVRHPTARRVQRHADEPDDQFIANVLEASTWATRNARAIIIGAIVLVVLVVGTIIFMSNRAAHREQAETALLTVLQTVQSGNTELAERELQTFLSNYGDTPAADHARLLLGQVYLQTEEPARAVEVLQPIADDLEEPFGASAALLLGAVHEATNDLARAEAAYLRVGENAPFDFQRNEGLDRAALLRLQQGNAAGAVELYERLVENAAENSPDRALYQIRLGEARAQVQA